MPSRRPSCTRSPQGPSARRHALQAGLALATTTPLAGWAAGEPGLSIAVLYPDIGEPFRQVFSTIVDGMREAIRQPFPTFAVGPEGLSPAQADELRRRDPRVLVALGRSGLKAVRALDSSAAVVAGCVLGMPPSQAQDYTVHSLAPDPALVFAGLRRIVPAVRRVFAVLDPQHNDWLLRLAHEAARNLGLELAAHEAEDVKRASRAYQDVLAVIDPRRDALWLPQDSTTVEEETLLPLLLQQAWQRSFPLVSSNALHVKRGALLALYPDNPALGRSLAQSALDTLANPRRAPRGLVPLRNVLTAANQRTAAHLGIALDPRAHRIDKLYPES